MLTQELLSEYDYSPYGHAPEVELESIGTSDGDLEMKYDEPIEDVSLVDDLKVSAFDVFDLIVLEEEKNECVKFNHVVEKLGAILKRLGYAFCFAVCQVGYNSTPLKE